MVGHFTQIVSDKSKFVGCALIHYTERHDNHYRYNMYFVCNYSFTNYIGEPVYIIGETASQCKSGTDAIYRGLCSKEEYYDENALPGHQSQSEPIGPQPSLSESSTTSKSLPESKSKTPSVTSAQSSTTSAAEQSSSSSSSGSKIVETRSTSYTTPASSTNTKTSTKTSTQTSTPSATSTQTSTPTPSSNEHSSSHYSKSKLSSYLSVSEESHPSAASSASKWSASFSEKQPKIVSSMSYDNVSSYTMYIPSIPHINASINNIPHVPHLQYLKPDLLSMPTVEIPSISPIINSSNERSIERIPAIPPIYIHAQYSSNNSSGYT